MKKENNSTPVQKPVSKSKTAVTAPHEKHKSMEEVVELAEAAGLSYGHYVAQHPEI